MPEALGRVKAKLLLVVAALAAGCPFGRTPFAPRDAAPLAWRDCGERFECAELSVPLDHREQRGTRLALAVVRRRAERREERLGVLVTNPGGPGISAVAHLRRRADDFSPELRERFDLVAFDTRGSGASAPLDCHASLADFLAADPTPESDASWQAGVVAARALAEECVRAHGALLPYLGTAESARDLELLRVALGEERLSYLGFSYGGALGAVYASLHPERVRALVLDAPVGPGLDLVTFAREQSAGVEGALDAYDREAAKRGWNGRDVLTEISLRAERAPIPSPHGRAARASDVFYGSVEALVAPPGGWSELSRALGAAQLGDGADFVALSDRYFGRRPDGESALRVEEQLAVLCADLPRPASLEAFRAALPEAAAAAPHFGVANQMSLLPCLFWPAPARPLDAVRAPEGAARLVVTATGDPLTPHVWGERMAAALCARRLDVDANVHTSLGRDSEVARAVAEVLVYASAEASCTTAAPATAKGDR